jgi:hypothetical protein
MTDKQATDWINANAPADLRWWIHDRLRSLASAPCSRMVLQRRYLSTDMPAPWREWHDHPEPHQIAWSKGQFETLDENMKNACANYYEMSPMMEFRMVSRTDETVWEYSANDKREGPPTQNSNEATK